MRIACTYCGADVEPGAVRIEEGALVFDCAKCGSPNRAALGGGGESGEPSARPRVPSGSEGATARAASPEVPSSGASVSCPKCGHRQSDRRACHRCGLVFELVERTGRRPWEEIPAEKRPFAEKADSLWSRVIEEPANAERHAEFVTWCQQKDLSDLALRRYRLRLVEHPEEEASRASFEKLVASAHAVAAAMRRGGESDPFVSSARTAKQVLLGAVIVACGAMAIWLFRIFSMRPDAGP